MVTRGLVDSPDCCQVLYRFFQAEKGLMSVADTCGEMFHLEPEMVNRGEALMNRLPFQGENNHRFDMPRCKWQRDGNRPGISDDLCYLARR